MAGYSGTPLPAKLGIKPGTRALLVAAPAGFDLGVVPTDARVHTRAGRTQYDVVVVFCANAATLHRQFGRLIERTAVHGGLWVAWPKRASGVATDLTEDAVRDHGLATGLVDVKVAAIDDTWSGLKFVRRRSDR